MSNVSSNDVIIKQKKDIKKYNSGDFDSDDIDIKYKLRNNKNDDEISDSDNIGKKK